jgi:hypothetical protein
MARVLRLTRRDDIFDSLFPDPLGNERGPTGFDSNDLHYDGNPIHTDRSFRHLRTQVREVSRDNS